MDLWEQLDGSEREAALLALDGLGARAIAQKLGVSDRDAERLVTRAFQRLGVSSRAGLEGIDVVAELERLEGWEW